MEERMMPFMISCRDAGLLISQKLDQPLKLMDRMHLRAHLLMCPSCPTLQQKFEVIHRMGKQFAESSQAYSSDDPGLSPEAKERIAKNLIQK
jgi:hypothetical protein